jgi:ribosomal protein S12 methylthiotransferase accessory factor
MLERPRMKAHYQVEIVGDDQVFLLAEGKHFLLTGAAVVALLPLLDGTRSVPDLVQAVADRVPMMAAFTAIATLEAGGHLAEGRPRPSAMTPGELAYWDVQGVQPAQVPGGLSATRIDVLGLGGIDPWTVVPMLAEAGLSVNVIDPDTDSAAAASGTGPLLLLTDDYLDPAVSGINDAMLETGRTWVLGKPVGRQLWLGPVLRPFESGCWRCLEQRVTANRQVERYLAGKRDGGPPRQRGIASSPAGTQIFAGLLGHELVRLAVTGRAARLEGRLLTLDTKTLSVEDHELIRQPQCPSCGDPTIVSGRSPKIVLSPRLAVHTTDGGHRVQPPAQTYARLAKHISPILGAVTTVSAHDDTDNGIAYSFTAGHNFAMVNDNIDLLKRNLRGQSGGKGRTEMQARVSAVCEALERYCAVWRGDEPVIRAPYDELDPVLRVHPDAMLLFSDAQFDGRDAWNRDPSHRLHLVPERFRTDLPVDWSVGWSLTENSERLVPAGMVYYGHPDLARHFYCVSDSNGSASGNTIEEAVLQGFCELVERDAVALWWYNRVPRPALDLHSLGDPYTDRLVEFYERADRDLWVLDITSDLQIPVFAAVSRRRHAVEDVMVGFGAHPDARLAAMRALTEVNQFLPYVDRRDANGATLYRTDDPDTLAWCREATVAAEPWLLPSPEPARVLTDPPPVAGTDLAEQVAHCVDRARTAGLEVIVLDQSRPDIEHSVVKVIAPGMRHFWRRLGPGRLYDVPVELGWRPAPTAEDELNPRSVFF